MKSSYILVLLTCYLATIQIVKSGGGDHCKNFFLLWLPNNFFGSCCISKNQSELNGTKINSINLAHDCSLPPDNGYGCEGDMSGSPQTYYYFVIEDALCYPVSISSVHRTSVKYTDDFC